jgi:hypothetical protein
MVSFRPTIFDRHILALDVARFIQALPEGDHPRFGFGFRQSGSDHADHRHRRLLRPRRERPRGRHAADERDELAPSPVEHGASRALGDRKDWAPNGRFLRPA